MTLSIPPGSESERILSTFDGMYKPNVWVCATKIQLFFICKNDKICDYILGLQWFYEIENVEIKMEKFFALKNIIK